MSRRFSLINVALYPGLGAGWGSVQVEAVAVAMPAGLGDGHSRECIELSETHPFPHDERDAVAFSERVFNKFGSLSKSGFQTHRPFLSNQGYAPTLTLPRRERELVKHLLRANGKAQGRCITKLDTHGK